MSKRSVASFIIRCAMVGFEGYEKMSVAGEIEIAPVDAQCDE